MLEQRDANDVENKEKTENEKDEEFLIEEGWERIVTNGKGWETPESLKNATKISQIELVKTRDDVVFLREDFYVMPQSLQEKGYIYHYIRNTSEGGWTQYWPGK